MRGAGGDGKAAGRPRNGDACFQLSSCRSSPGPWQGEPRTTSMPTKIRLPRLRPRTRAAKPPKPRVGTAEALALFIVAGMIVLNSRPAAELLSRLTGTADPEALAPDAAVAETLEPARGRDARSPFAMPLKGWKDVLARTWQEFNDDQIAAVAGGVTFFGLLALFPAMAAFVSLYGLFADVAQARQQLNFLAGFLPRDILIFVGDEMVRIAGGGTHGPRLHLHRQPAVLPVERERGGEGALPRSEHRLRGARDPRARDAEPRQHGIHPRGDRVRTPRRGGGAHRPCCVGLSRAGCRGVDPGAAALAGAAGDTHRRAVPRLSLRAEPGTAAVALAHAGGGWRRGSCGWPHRCCSAAMWPTSPTTTAPTAPWGR